MLNEILTNYSTFELTLGSLVFVLICIIVYMLIKIKKLSFDFYSKSVSHTVEKQTKKIVELEKELSIFKREDTGVLVKWAPAREDKAAYLLTIYNDTAEKIYNLDIEIEEQYKSVSRVFFKRDSCESQKQVLAFFMPGGWSSRADTMTNRDGFVKLWSKNKLKPIKFTVRYTTSPIVDGDSEVIEIEFNRTHISKHMANKIRNLHKKLTVVPKLQE